MSAINKLSRRKFVFSMCAGLTALIGGSNAVALINKASQVTTDMHNNKIDDDYFIVNGWVLRKDDITE